MALINKILGQVRSATTANPVLVYECPENKAAVINNIFIANTTGTQYWVSIFIHNGTVAVASLNQIQAIMYQVPVPANSTVEISGGDDGYGLEVTDEIAFQQEFASAFTITVFGKELAEQL